MCVHAYTYGREAQYTIIGARLHVGRLKYARAVIAESMLFFFFVLHKTSVKRYFVCIRVK